MSISRLHTAACQRLPKTLSSAVPTALKSECGVSGPTDSVTISSAIDPAVGGTISKDTAPTDSTHISSTIEPVDGTSPSSIIAPPPGTAPAALTGPVGFVTALLLKELDPNDVNAWDKAEAYYDKVRDCPGDIEAISAHTPFHRHQIETVKNHLFYNTHILDDGPRRFDADPLIANAWSRMQAGNHGPKDLQLVRHELFEARFEAIFHTDYRTAHQAADRSGRPSGLYA